MALPTPVQELWDAWGDIQGNANLTIMVNLLGVPGDHRDAIKSLMLSDGGKSSCLRTLDLAPEVPPEADIHLVVLDAVFGPTQSQAATLRKINPKGLVAVLVGAEGPISDSRKREVAAAIGVKAGNVVAVERLSGLGDVLAKRLLSSYDEWVVPLARQFPFLRDQASVLEVNSTSQQNALVGSMPLPGADMPIMTANQIKMILRLAAIHDRAMTLDRAKEVLAVVGSGLVLRTVARQLTKFIPGPGWLVGGAMGYGGTQAIGRGAIEYFKRSNPDEESGSSQPDHRAHGDDVIDAVAEVIDESHPDVKRR